MYDSEDQRKKRVGKACDSCRMKKTKCDGEKPCSKCSADNKICTYSEKKKQQEKTYSSGYVELLENRISILQNCLQTLIGKIANHEDVSHYVPAIPGDLRSINKVIELLSESKPESPSTSSVSESSPVDSHLSHDSTNTHEALFSPSNPASVGASSPHFQSPATSWSSGAEEEYEEDKETTAPEPDVTPEVQPSVTTESQPEFSYFGDQAAEQQPNEPVLDLGGFPTGAALAAAAISGNYVSADDTSSPMSSSRDDQSPVFWGTVSPADLESPMSISLPHNINNGAYAPGHMSKLHRVGSPHHIQGQQAQRSAVGQSPYTKQQSVRRRNRSSSRTPHSLAAARHASADNLVRSNSLARSLSGAPSLSSTASSVTSSSSSFSPSLSKTSSEAAVSSLSKPNSAVIDDGKINLDARSQYNSGDIEPLALNDYDAASFVFGSTGEFVQMEELNSNLDELWLGQMC